MNFGQAFGYLIKRYRGIEGLTQQALAVRAFGKESYKTRISELENGRVENPHQKTIDALVVALNIPQPELDKLFKYIPELRLVDTLFDFFSCDPGRPLDFEVAVNYEGKVRIFVDAPPRKEIRRLEYFMAEDGARRPAIKLAPQIGKHLTEDQEIPVIQTDGNTPPSAVDGYFLPLRVFV